MCGESNFTYKNEYFSFYLGYYGGSISIDSVSYENEFDEKDRIVMKEFMSKYSKEELIEIILRMVDNGDE